LNIKEEGEPVVDRSLKFKILEKFRYQADLAQRTGIREERLSRIVNGRVNPSEVERNLIARALRVKPDELFQG
jgi:transcriptional regulator with XRE-family HTH domain